MERSGRKPISVENMLVRMADLCARCEQCESDLRDKMLRGGLRNSDVDSVIAYLRGHDFLNDARFAGAFCRDKARFSGWGRRKIRVALMQKRLPDSVIEEALKSIDINEYARRLLAIARLKSRGVDLNDFNSRQKIFMSLLRRGFESSLIGKALAKIASERGRQ